MTSSSKKDNTILAAKVLKPQGIKGELKLEPYTDANVRFPAGSFLLLKNVRYEVASARRGVDGYLYVRLKGVNDRNAAEDLRDADVYIERSALPALPEDRIYIADLIGAEVTDGETTYGKLTDILQYGAADVYCVAGKKPFMFPAAPGIILKTDVENGKIIVDAGELQKAAVYED